MQAENQIWNYTILDRWKLYIYRRNEVHVHTHSLSQAGTIFKLSKTLARETMKTLANTKIHNKQASTPASPPCLYHTSSPH
jgi:hypothetical protein